MVFPGRFTELFIKEKLDRVSLSFLVDELRIHRGGIESSGQPAMTVDAAVERGQADPTGVGDAFRAGFFAAISWGLSLQRAAQTGCVMATLVLETAGTQEYEVEPADFAARLGEAYGAGPAAEVLGAMPAPAHQDR